MKVPRMLLMLFFLLPSLLLASEHDEERLKVRLLQLERVAPPEVFDDTVIFTAPSSYRRVGIAFEHERYATVHWYKKLVRPQEFLMQDDGQGPDARPALGDSGLLIHTMEMPEGLQELRYRLVIEGLWSVDPWNPDMERDDWHGIGYSRVALPDRSELLRERSAADNVLDLNFKGAAGEIISVAGTFNNWDPFMYELVEETPGRYHLSLRLPPGTYRYVFHYRGERILDPQNPRKVYTSDGKTASEIIVH